MGVSFVHAVVALVSLYLMRGSSVKKVKFVKHMRDIDNQMAQDTWRKAQGALGALPPKAGSTFKIQDSRFKITARRAKDAEKDSVSGLRKSKNSVSHPRLGTAPPLGLQIRWGGIILIWLGNQLPKLSRALNPLSEASPPVADKARTLHLIPEREWSRAMRI